MNKILRNINFRWFFYLCGVVACIGSFTQFNEIKIWNGSFVAWLMMGITTALSGVILSIIIKDVKRWK